MAKEVAFASLRLIRKEMDVLQQNLALRDRSPVAVKLRNVVDHIAVGDQIYPKFKGLTCDLPLSIPQGIFDATSKASYHGVLHYWFAKAQELVESTKIVDRIRECISSLRELATSGPQSEESIGKTWGQISVRLQESIELFKRRTAEIKNQIEQELDCQIEEAEEIVKDLKGIHEQMLGSAGSMRAINTTAYLDKVLELSSYAKVHVPLDGIKGDGFLDKVNLGSPPASSEDDNLLSYELPFTKGPFANGLDSMKAGEGMAFREKHLGSIVALAYFNSQVLKRLSLNEQNTLAAAIGKLASISQLKNLDEEALACEIERYKDIEEAFEGALRLMRPAQERLEEANSALEFAKFQRQEGFMVSKEESAALLENLSEQRDLLLKILSFLAEFNKQIVRLNLW